MRIMQITKNNGMNLSVTVQKQNYNASPKRSKNTVKSEKFALVGASLHEFPECSGGVCQVTWKPLHHTA